MRRLSRASLWMLTRKSTGSRDTEITAFAVMPSVPLPYPVVTTVTPDGKRLIASRRASDAASRVSQPCFFSSCSPSAGNSVSFVEVGAQKTPSTLLRVGFFGKAFSHAKLIGPPALYGFPVRSVPAAPGSAEEAAVVNAVEDEGLGPGEQGRWYGNLPVSSDSPIADEAFVATADPAGRNPIHGVAGYAEVMDVGVKCAGEELVDLGDRGECAPVRHVVGGTQGNEVAYATVTRVAAPAVGGVPAKVRAGQSAACRIAYEHGL